MVRFYLVLIITLSVLLIGLPFDTPVTNLSYQVLRRFGLDVSMTPLTVDMSMMRDGSEKFNYNKKLALIVNTNNGEELIGPRALDLYLHKVPLILYYEVWALGGEMKEGLFFLCRSLESFSRGGEVRSFSFSEDPRDIQHCP